MPQSAALHCSVQLTPFLSGSKLTVAVNCSVAPAVTSPDALELTIMAIAGTVMMTELESAALPAAVAMRVTGRSVRGAAGGAL